VHVLSEETNISSGSAKPQSSVARALQIEWLGQTAASLCWIASVFAYGISAAGDYLQLFAASAWLIANIAAIASPRGN